MNKLKRITASLMAMVIMLGTFTGIFSVSASAADSYPVNNVELVSIKYTFYDYNDKSRKMTATNIKNSTPYQVMYNGYQSDADGYLDKGNPAAYVEFKEYESGSGGKIFQYSGFDAEITLRDKNTKITSEKDLDSLKGYVNGTRINTDMSDFVPSKKDAAQIKFGWDEKANCLLIKVTFENLIYADQSDTSLLTFSLKYQQGSSSPVNYSDNKEIKIQMLGAKKAKHSDAGPGDHDNNDDADDNGNTGVSVRTATPYIIINDYSIDNDSIAAGDTFDLTINIQNTHYRLGVENILMTITTGDGLQLTNSSNTFYISKLRAEAPIEKTIKFSVLPNAEVKSHPINIEFSYEYVANDERSTGQTRETITVPVIQKDRFSAFVSEVSPEIYPGEEGDLSASYVNKGRSEIFNLTASIICDGISNPGQEQNLGNLAAGASGDVDFYLKPIVEGDFTGEVLFTYEDANTNIKEYRVHFNSHAMPQEEEVLNPDMTDPSMMGDPGMEEGMANTAPGIPNWIWGCIAGGVVVVIIIVVVVVTKKKKAAKEFDDEDI